MSDSHSVKADSCVILNELADEITERYRRGERPSLKEYLDRHPELADDIRELFPLLVEMERVKKDQQASLERPAPAPRLPLERLGDFRILREIGHGGMGVVYEAEQVSLGRHVALKVLSRRLQGVAKQRQRFEREARAAARLHHTNIVPVFGVGEHDGVPYYVMQFIQGLGLDVVIAELTRLGGAVPIGGESCGRVESPAARDVALSLLSGEWRFAPPGHGAAGLDDATVGVPPVPPMTPAVVETIPSASAPSLPLPTRGGTSKEHRAAKATYWHSVARIGLQVADALDYAHRQKVLHRDIKPSNLLLDTSGAVWVTDFGLAKAEDQPDLTDTGDLLGTLRYMPPEAFEGTSDVRSDLYSLGLTLYELLAFRPTFDQKEQLALVRQVTRSEPPRLGLVNPQIPRDLETVVHKCIDREPAHRYQTAGELAADLQRYLDDEPIRARRITLAERLARWARRNRGIAAALFAIAVLLMLLAGGSSTAAAYFRQGKEEQAVLAERNQKLAQEKEGERAKVVGALDEAERGRLREAALRQEADDARKLAEDREAERRRDLYLAEMNLAGRAADSPSGIGRVASLLDNWREGRPDLRGWEWYYLDSLCHRDLRTFSGGSRAINCVAWGPDGKSFASGDTNGTVHIWRIDSARATFTLDAHKAPVRAIAWSPDGKWLASAGGDEPIKLWATATGGGGPTWEAGTSELAWSADGKRLIARKGARLLEWEPATRREVKSTWLAGKFGPGTSRSPDGKRVADATSQRVLRVWDGEKNQVVFSVSGLAGLHSPLVWSPDAGSLAVGDRDTIRILDPKNGQVRHTLLGHKNSVEALAWRADGRRLASAGRDGTVRVWDTVQGAEVACLRGHVTPVRSVAWSPDGKRLLSGSVNGVAKLWDAEAGSEVAALRGRSSVALAWSPDSKSLASADRNGVVHLWPAAGGKPLELPGQGGQIRDIAWHPEGRWLAAGRKNNTVWVWDVAAGTRVHSWGAHANEVHAVAWSPDGRWLATGGGDGRARLWEAGKWTPVRELGKPGHAVKSLAWAPEGDRLAGGGGTGQVKVWDVGTGKELYSLRGEGTGAYQPTIAWSPDGRWIAASASGSAGNGFPGRTTLTLWDALTGEEVRRLCGHFAELTCAAWSPDGRRLATASEDETVKLWDPATAREVMTLGGHSDAVRVVAWSPDGKKLATAGDDAVILIHDATTGLSKKP